MKTDEEINRCPECGMTEFVTWIEYEYDDGAAESHCGNQLIEIEFVECKNCGETL